MTKREAAIVSAYTGFLLGSFTDMHAYAEEVLGRPVFTHEFGATQVADALRQASKADFVSLAVTDAHEPVEILN